MSEPRPSPYPQSASAGGDVPLQVAARLHRSGQLQEAAAAYRELLARNPEDPVVCHLMGMLLAQMGRVDEAIRLLRQSIQFAPSRPEFHNNLASLLGSVGQHEQAVPILETALRIRPDYPDALNNLGVALEHLGHFDEAIAALRRAVSLRPDFFQAHTVLSNALRKAGQTHEAETAARLALKYEPRYLDAHNALGAALMEQCRATEAIAAYQRVLELQPDHMDAQVNRAMALLSLGDYQAGWREFEHRLQHPGWKHEHPGIRWNGANPDGKTIVLVTEGGLGNLIQFVRFAPALARRGANVIVECQPALKSLMASVPGVREVVGLGEPLPQFDFYVPMMSLPMLLKVNAAELADDVPYVSARADRAERWRCALQQIQGYRVGICWRGDQRIVHRRHRSIPLSEFAPLAGVPGVRLISLQTDANLSGDLPVVRFGDMDSDGDAFVDTVAILKHLDLVITCDTSIAHLAGAMRIPVWVALPFAADWRWMLDRQDTPWYPTMRLFRQSQSGDWAGVFQRIAQALSAEVARRQA